ncbi:MAG: hypothetical protein LBP59_20300 [Planctomycetaceae bacterium]|nr:hypothetical protein [Planctomycetaceae bacterium]
MPGSWASRLHSRIAGISPAFQDRGRHVCIPGSRASRLHSRIAGVSPACGCTQPPLSGFISQPIFCLPFGKL